MEVYASVPVMFGILAFLYEWRGGNSMEAWVSFITELSFPIAITFYLLHRIEGKLDMLNDSIRMLPDELKE